jgi:hypothetical protein
MIRRYIILTSTKTAQLPYADAFVPSVKYCITWVSKDRCKLSCYTGVKFLKNVLVKGMVSKAAMKGMSENLAIFMPIVKNEANRVTRRKGSGSKEKADVSLKRMGTIKRPSKGNLDEDGKHGQAAITKAASSGWYGQVEQVTEIVQDLLEALPFMVKVGAAAVLMLWLMVSWLRAGSRRSYSVVNSKNEVQYPPVASRAVYLRDINEGLLDVDMKPAYGHSER